MPDFKVNAHANSAGPPQDYTVAAENRKQLDELLKLMWPDGKIVGIREVKPGAQQ